MEKWYQATKTQADFYIVYIREAHPEDGRQVQANRRDGVIVKTAKSEEDRKEAAQACSVGLEVSLPMIVDGMDDAVERAYQGWPDRIYIVDLKGNVWYRSAPGPAGFKPAEAELALRNLLKG
ncbi:MAG: hypothetical protein QY327_09030 [Fimbriimonadaceae bacterium]|nr:hypothetical protein [Fimbriimonadaceae bacterium]QOJ13035.1 MAG: deiodinase [Chthonomonadaceae bacterium]WKZ81577.1 MAG: hypothetical protein QY327_09030 [Fimbriimonadaceae bacterium]